MISLTTSKINQDSAGELLVESDLVAQLKANELPPSLDDHENQSLLGVNALRQSS
jgi:hypothetical protein